MNDPDRIRQFIRISEVLLGRTDLSEPLACIYLRMLDDKDCAGPLGALEGLLIQSSEGPSAGKDERIAQALDSTKVTEVRLLAQRILCLWYTSVLYENPADVSGQSSWSQPGPAEAYFQAFMWETASTHPMGVTGPFYGEWAYPPQHPSPKKQNL